MRRKKQELTQLELPLKRKHKHGGARKGAGRKRTRDAGVAHRSRPMLTGRHPLHVTLKLQNIDSPRMPLFRAAFSKIITRAKEKGLHINHYSLQNDHIHLICEANSKKEMSRGFRSLNTAIALKLKKIHKTIRKFKTRHEGRVFSQRFHLHVLKTPSEVKNALRYVLLNSAKHSRSKPFIDAFSSAGAFTKWRELLKGTRPAGMPDSLASQIANQLCPPRSWLLNVGWMRVRVI